jgi:heat-inducible transcriptional repressor
MSAPASKIAKQHALTPRKHARNGKQGELARIRSAYQLLAFRANLATVSDLSPRAKLILYAAVSEFVQTGEPVGSRTLSRRGIELSPATIRSVLADLEEQGFLAQPHTSAGRIPTDRAFRVYVDALMEVRKLSREEDSLIRTRVGELQPGASALRETGRFLSELTQSVAVVVAPRGEGHRMKQLRFLRTGKDELLAVLILTDGSVQNRFISAPVSEDELVRIHNLLDDVVEGRSLGDLRELFARRRATERVQADGFRRAAYELGAAAVAGIAESAAEVAIEGRAKLLDRPEFSGAEHLKQIAGALEDEGKLLRLLDAMFVEHSQGVLVGHEAAALGAGQLSVVGSAYARTGDGQGAVAVIGPTRMDYSAVVPLVQATATAMSDLYRRPLRTRRDTEEE